MEQLLLLELCVEAFKVSEAVDDLPRDAHILATPNRLKMHRVVLHAAADDANVDARAEGGCTRPDLVGIEGRVV